MRRLILSFIVVTLIFSVGPKAGAITLPVPAGFSIEQTQGYKTLTVKSPWPGATKGFTYILYPRGSPKPAGVEADKFIQTPVRSVVSFSTTYIPALEAIGELGALKGVDSVDYVYNPAVRQAFAAGKIVQTTKNWAPDIERLIALAPDVIFAFGMGNEWDTHPKMDEAGLPVVILGDWNEQESLARAEWAVFLAAFFDKEEVALKLFAETSARYSSLKALAAKPTTRPTVLVSGPYSGTWSVSAGESYMAKLLADAGSNYLWAGSRGTGSLTLSIEAVFEKALGATVWLNPSLGATRLSDVRAMDPRFSALPALAKGNVWNNNARMSPGGGNDYYESAAMRPDLTLSDLIAIFHPEILPAHVFTYYRKLGDK
jgi:iron complex transport system substrate-binding protein